MTNGTKPGDAEFPTSPLSAPGNIREPDGDTGRTRFYVREGQEPQIGFPAIEWREEATREWLEGLAAGKSIKRH